MAATVPKVSFIRIISAPANRAVPDISCWLDSSLTALVSIRPGISTISEATITVLSDSGSMKVATAAASSVAISAAIASSPSARRGRPAPSTYSTPISVPMVALVITSAQPVLSRPATAAAESPKLSAVSTSARRCEGRSRSRSAAYPDSRSSLPASTSSAMASVAASRPRFWSPGARRMTRVMPFCWPRTGSAKLRMMPVGLEKTSQSRPRRCATASTAPSRRWAEVPYTCSRVASSATKAACAS